MHKKRKTEDVEVLAAKARVARAQTCSDAINALLEKQNCQMVIVTNIGGQPVPASDILKLPLAVLVQSK